jgi:hypothetical protein
MRSKARMAALEGVAARAGQEHAWSLAGDDRGIYGEHMLEQID